MDNLHRQSKLYDLENGDHSPLMTADCGTLGITIHASRASKMLPRALMVRCVLFDVVFDF